MLISTITSKGQLTVPVAIRKVMGVKASDKVIFKRKGKKIFVEKLPSLDSLFGSLSNPNVKPLTISQMKRLLEKEMFGKNDIA